MLQPKNVDTAINSGHFVLTPTTTTTQSFMGGWGGVGGLGGWSKALCRHSQLELSKVDVEVGLCQYPDGSGSTFLGSTLCVMENELATLFNFRVFMTKFIFNFQVCTYLFTFSKRIYVPENYVPKLNS